MISSAVLRYGTFGNDGVFGVLGLSAHGPHLVVQLLQATHSSAQSLGRPDMNESYEEGGQNRILPNELLGGGEQDVMRLVLHEPALLEL